MSTAAPRGVGNPQVLAIAGAVAGAVGGVLVALTSARRKQNEPASRLAMIADQLHAEEAARRARDLAAAATARASATVRAAAPAATEGARRGRDDVRSAVEAVAGRGREDVRSAVEVVTERSRETRDRLTNQLEKRSDVADRASSVVDELAARSRQGAKTLLEQGESYAAEGLKRARGTGETVAEASRQRVPELRERVEKQVVPLIQEVGGVTSTRAQELYGLARERAVDARRTAEKDVAPAVADLSAQARGAVVVASARLGEEAEHLGERLSAGSGVAAERASAVGKRAQEGTKQAADATVQGSKDFGAFLLWLTIGGAVIYYVFLDERQREQVQQFAQRVFAEGREVYQDIQGRDEEFT